MDDDSFFLYGIGEKPDALTLGSLVLEKYWMPLIARHYTHDPLRYSPSTLSTTVLIFIWQGSRGEHLEAHAWTSKLTNLVLHGRTRLTPGIGISGFDIVDLRLAWNKDQERYVTAKSGQKITLKEYTPPLPSPSTLREKGVYANARLYIVQKNSSQPKYWPTPKPARP